ncbi:MAG TPA: M14 family zinc carboxypeptidase, partial [Vicinamibacteria bacterium]|nr:M14 family zinc carboxypeptidase [Vicinamibacteria bacterium]
MALQAALLLAPTPARPEAQAVPAPRSVLGFVPGDERRLPDWGEVVDYLSALAAASPRLRLEEVGRTTEGRPFLLVTVTSPENQAHLEEIRQASARLWDPRGLSAEEERRLLQAGRTVVAMTFSIHSTEVGGTLAALLLLHHLASAEDPETRAVLDQTV